MNIFAVLPAPRVKHPTAGAKCQNWARPDLCGGRPATVVLTAIDARLMGKW
jgi:hypothetical protein